MAQWKRADGGPPFPLSTPPSPLSPPPHPLSPDSVLDLSITAEPRPPRTTRRKVQQPIVGQRNSCLRGNSSAIGQVRPEPETPNHTPESAATSNQVAACPEGAELNTTLALRAELQSVQEAQWDAAKALKQSLEKNQRSQTLLNCRATQGVSFPRRARLYSALVSVHVSEGHVIRQAALQRLPLAAAPKAPPVASAGPSLLPLTSDLYSRPLPPSPSPAPCIRPRPHSAPFSLFQRQQRWTAAP
ncbi:protein phosphatase 1 regulatory subunit 35 [Boleophthalmus pectinirostris]|uniref:protein phosphatase 1 regulatory subunit 35 n=1 Tax=Boleophthalmus pectinirostris TaxID=150288 RepID=UPI00242D0923|nr:protein phosphatase 1 regulatory subunit 35 [Boleophthalmus pectinirostris]